MDNQVTLKNKILIVGQGLAGTILADSLLEKDQTVNVIDENDINSSSRVAGGIVNPITGKRFSISWKAKKLIPFAKEYYRSKEKVFKSNFYNELPIFRMFSSYEDENTFMAKTGDPKYDEFLSKTTIEVPETIKADFGGFETKEGAWLDTSLFLDHFKDSFEASQVLINQKFDFSLLVKKNNQWTYNEEDYDYVIFCEGYKATDNPYFNWLPFNLAKGEILKIKSSELSSNKLINKNGFILPLGKDEFNVGATFKWEEINQETTLESREELIEKLKKITTAKYEIIDQKAGVRPTVKDRRPFIGWHPEHKNLGIFNGMGAKGVSVIPFFADEYTKHILNNSDIDSEVNIERYYSNF